MILKLKQIFLNFITKPNLKPRMDDLKNASDYLYKQANPFVPYKLINELIANTQQKPSAEIRLIAGKKMESAATHTIKQQLLISSPYLLQQAIIANYDKQKKLDFPLPNSYLNFLHQKKINVDYKNSRLKFIKIVLGNLYNGLRIFSKLIINKSSVFEENKTTCTIIGAPLGILPIKNSTTFLHWLDSDSPLKNIFDHYRIVCSSDVASEICFPKTVTITKNIFPNLTYYRKAKFFLVSLLYLLISSLLLVFGRWQLAILSKEIILLTYFRCLAETRKSAAYIFFCHNLSSRPLWTYLAEKEHRSIVNVFYASSYTLFTYGNKPVEDDIKLPYIQIANWPEYWVQTDGFNQTLLSLISNPAKVKTVGVFPFTDSGKPIPLIKGRKVLVFDVDPSNDFLLYTKHGYIIPNLTDEIVTAFWQDLYICAKDLKIQLIHKRKRNDPITSESYKAFLDSISKEKEYYKQLPCDLNTLELIHNNIHVPTISIPFTSTAEIGIILGGKHIYYNTLAKIHTPEKHSCNVPTIYGIDNLKVWLKLQFKGD